MKQNANWAWSGGIPREDRDVDPMSFLGHSTTWIPRTRPPKPVPVDLDALAGFNEGVERARDAYHAEHKAVS